MEDLQPNEFIEYMLNPNQVQKLQSLYPALDVNLPRWYIYMPLNGEQVYVRGLDAQFNPIVEQEIGMMVAFSI
jgi:hypothetical protein